MHNIIEVVKDSQTRLILVHKDGPSQNIHVNLRYSKSLSSGLEWSGLPESWVKKLKYRFSEEIIVEYPAMAVRTIIDETLQKTDGLRPFEEYQQVIQAACPIKKGKF